MAKVEYKSTVGMNAEPFIRHFKEQAEGKKPTIHLIPTAKSFGGSQRRQGLVLLQQGRGMHKENTNHVARIETIDPVQSATNQASAMLDQSIKDIGATHPTQSRTRPRRTQKGKSTASAKTKSKGKATTARKVATSTVARQRTQRVKDVFSRPLQTERIVQ